MQQLAFVTGIARSGTNLIGRMLGQHQEFAVAMDPFLPVLKWFRSAVAARAIGGGTPELCQPVPPSAPIDDYYFMYERQRLMDAIQAADLTIPFEQDSWRSLQADLEGRAIHECADLVPHLIDLKAATYAAIWEAGVNLVARVRGNGACRWVGIKELWCVEFIPHLHAACPSAKSVVILRDPRAAIASMLKMGENDPTQQAQICSYVRHWRKLIAFVTYYRTKPTVADRLLTIRYEDLVCEPEQTAQEICRFFQVQYDPAMVDMAGCWDPSRRSRWQGNSSYESSLSKIDSELASRWEGYLSDTHLRLIEYLCGPDMVLAGYRPRSLQLPVSEAEVPADAFLSSYGALTSWRSDSGDPLLDLGLEVVRRVLLVGASRPDDSLLKRCFLFPEVYDRLRDALEASSSSLAAQ
jgi:hypothetical protein